MYNVYTCVCVCISISIHTNNNLVHIHVCIYGRICVSTIHEMINRKCIIWQINRGTWLFVKLCYLIEICFWWLIFQESFGSQIEWVFVSWPWEARAVESIVCIFKSSKKFSFVVSRMFDVLKLFCISDDLCLIY